MYFFKFTSDFQNSFKKIDGKIQQDIKKKLSYLSELECPLLYAKRISGYKDIFRFRCGNYRILFRLEKKNIILLLVKHRKEIYESL